MTAPLRRLTRRAALALAVVALALALHPAQSAAQSATLSDRDRRDVSRVEAYLNSIRSMRATFLQTSSNGDVAHGRIYLQRPKRLRLDYRQPAALQVYVNGDWLVFVDTELREITHVPVDATPAALLVGDPVALSGDVSVTRIERTPGALRLHIVQNEEPEAGVVILTFSDRPLRLRKWTLVDAQGIKTQVSLIAPEYNVRIGADVFRFDESRFEEEPQD